MKFTLQTILLFVFLLFVQACVDIQETELEEDVVQLRAPGDGLITETQAQVFWWEALEGVDYYKIQIVTPSFDAPVALVEEAEVEGTSYEFVLNDGTYQWTVIGVNSVSESEPEIFDLTVMADTSANISNQNVALVAPVEQALLNSSEVTFLWTHLASIDEYRIQIASPDFSSSTFIVMDERTGDDFYTTSLNEGSYTWRVRAENDNSVTPYNSRNLEIDLTAPTLPLLLLPEQGDTITPPSNLTWELNTDAFQDTLYVYSDSLITPPILKIATTATSFLFEETTVGDYFWRIRSVDEAGNTSDFSTLRKFFVE